jgi:hypothetical protein
MFVIWKVTSPLPPNTPTPSTGSRIQLVRSVFGALLVAWPTASVPLVCRWEGGLATHPERASVPPMMRRRTRLESPAMPPSANHPFIGYPLSHDTRPDGPTKSHHL